MQAMGFRVMLLVENTNNGYGCCWVLAFDALLGFWVMLLVESTNNGYGALGASARQPLLVFSTNKLLVHLVSKPSGAVPFLKNMNSQGWPSLARVVGRRKSISILSAMAWKPVIS